MASVSLSWPDLEKKEARGRETPGQNKPTSGQRALWPEEGVWHGGHSPVPTLPPQEQRCLWDKAVPASTATPLCCLPSRKGGNDGNHETLHVTVSPARSVYSLGVRLKVCHSVTTQAGHIALCPPPYCPVALFRLGS